MSYSSDEGEERPTNGNAGAGGKKERWEDIQRSWDLVTEGADGSLAGMVEGLAQAGKRKRSAHLHLEYDSPSPCLAVGF